MALVWLIDDDPDIRLLVRSAFEIASPDAMLIEFENGTLASEALQALARGEGKTPAFALIDQRMPGIHGLELVELAKSLGPDERMALYILTSSDDARERQTALAAGAHAYLTKPLGFDELLTQVQQLVEKHLL